MSNKSISKRVKKVSLPLVPRKLEEIQAEYVKLLSRAGELGYQVHAYSKELDKVNLKMEELNYEGAARQELDKKNPPAPAAPSSAVEEQPISSGAV